jgi:hypothetical protein
MIKNMRIQFEDDIASHRSEWIGEYKLKSSSSSCPGDHVDSSCTFAVLGGRGLFMEGGFMPRSQRHEYEKAYHAPERS